jgi:hypothetical protein
MERNRDQIVTIKENKTMNKKWMLCAMLVVALMVVGCADAAGTETVADASARGARQTPGLSQNNGSGEVGVILHPDMVHGLVRRPDQTETAVTLHPDVVHGLVRRPAQTEMAATQQTGGSKAVFSPLYISATPLHPDVVHGLVRRSQQAQEAGEFTRFAVIKAVLHPDVVHGLVPSPQAVAATSLLKSPLHPDVVHGLVRPAVLPDLVGD